MSLPENFKTRGIELSKDCTIYGTPLRELTHSELPAVAAMGWHLYSEQLKAKGLRQNYNDLVA